MSLVKSFSHLLLILLCIVLMSASTAFGQAQELCKGNLGANIFEDGTFGKGTNNVVNVDPGIAPGYSFVNYIPNDGEYGLTKNTGFFNLYPTWLTVGDRTGDGGYIMVVNASFQPGIFYEKEVTGLCPNTLYEFSAEVINLIKREVTNHILPNIAFLLDGQVKYITGPIPQNEQWNKVGFSFVTAVGQTSLKLTLRNNAEGGIGNDLALDNISFRPCGPKSFINADTDKTIYKCKDGDPFKITADIGVADQYILWQVSNDGLNWNEISKGKSAEITHTEFSPDKYYYRYLTSGDAANIDNAKCRVISDQLLIEVVPDEYLVWDTICEGLSYQFGDTAILSAGKFDKFFVSSLGCDSLVHLNLHHTSDDNFSLDPEYTDPDCFGENSGSLSSFGASGGDPPYINTLLNQAGLPVGDARRLPAGKYTLVSVDRFKCKTTYELVLNDPDQFVVETGKDTTVDLGTTLKLPFQSTYPDVEIQWAGFGLNSDEAEPIYRPSQSTTVFVTGINEKGCIASDSMQIQIDNNFKVFYPNILSRQGGVNSTFWFRSLNDVIDEIEEFSLYDRWGNVLKNNTQADLNAVFEVEDHWTPGVYTFQATIRLINGQKFTKIGTVQFVN